MSNAMEKEIRILHLEDDVADAELIYATLESAGIPCKITRVQSSGEFSDALRKGEYDLILADYRLPNYDGISALHFIQERYSDIPFIFISGTMGEDAAIQALTEGATDYVLKQKLSRLAPSVVRVLREAENRKKQKQTEEALRDSEERYRTLVEQASDGIFLADSQGNYLDVNPSGCNMLGYTREEILKLNMKDLSGARDQAISPLRFDELRSGKIILSERILITKSGALLPVEISGKFLEDGNLQGIVRDITERKQAEEERLAHLRFFESMDQVNRAIQGTNDLEQMMGNVLDVVLSVFDCDRAWLNYPCDPEADVLQVLMERTKPAYPGSFALGIEVTITPALAASIRIALDSSGPVGYGPGNKYPLQSNLAERFSIQSQFVVAIYPRIGKPWMFGLHQCSYPRIWTPEEERLFQEIGRRLSDALSSLLSHRNVQESEERYRGLVELSPDSIGIYSEGKIVFANSATVRMSGAKSEEELIGKPVLDFIPPDARETVKNRMEELLAAGKPMPFVEGKFLRLDGSTIDVEAAAVPFNYQGKTYVQLILRDIIERKHHEREHEAIIIVSNALRQAATRAEILTAILDQLVDLFDADGAMLVLPNPQTGGFIDEMGRGVVGKKMTGLNIPPGQGVCNWVITNKKPYLNNHADRDPLFYRPDLLGDSHCVASAPLIAKEQAIGALWIARQANFVEQDLRLLNAIADIAANAIHRVMLHEQTEQQLHHLIALHQIDLAISTNFDLAITLNVILNNVKDELEVDAACILLLDPVTHTLDYAAGIGFRTRGIEQSHVKLGDGFSGSAALEYRTVSYPDLRLARETFSRSSLLAGEEFAAHYATPLVVKGQIKGVLELFHRKTLDPTQEWLDYFETLATQAAIAIESASLLENLQRSNMELMLAYDATIEGWSRALDLRDKETEGHTQRVTEMALELAEKMGMSNAEKQDLWRGGLLHDIGKMGVPDSILLKPGHLTDSEWEVMRRHPMYAYQMLSPISYLKHALDIPYCHHEKWDGSGYPRGLRGDEIPLPARMFAVVDVFDALTSDRPYRKAWPREDVYHYIQEQAGKHFDPQVVKIFLESRSR